MKGGTSETEPWRKTIDSDSHKHHNNSRVIEIDPNMKDMMITEEAAIFTTIAHSSEMIDMVAVVVVGITLTDFDLSATLVMM